jgi:hypothetical protein
MTKVRVYVRKGRQAKLLSGFPDAQLHSLLLPAV